MSTFWKIGAGQTNEVATPVPEEKPLSAEDAESILNELAGTYSKDKDIVGSLSALHHFFESLDRPRISDAQLPNLEAKYRALVEQLPAVVFMAYLDRGIGEAYVSPQIEEMLGFSQSEWLEDPVFGTGKSIPTTRTAGASRLPRCFFRARHCAPPTG